MVSLQDGCIDYMILSFGGILGLGDSLFLIPWRAITVDPIAERLVLNVEPEVLDEAPLFDVDNLPDFNSPDWDMDARTFWEGVELSTLDMTDSETMTGTTGTMAEPMAGMGSPCAGALAGFGVENTETAASETMTDTTGTDEGIEVETPRVSRLSELLSFDVTNPDGEDLGAIEDIMIDWRQDRVVYMLLSFGGILGLGEKWFPLPLDQITLDPIEQRFVVDIEPERLEAAPGFDEAELPDTADPNWDEEIRSYWLQTQ
jgi:sporulation protein YlmC with PRC-barrel domain